MSPHLYKQRKGGPAPISVGRSQLFLMCANQSARCIKDENSDDDGMNPHLCQNRKGGPAPWAQQMMLAGGLQSGAPAPVPAYLIEQLNQIYNPW
jgi:hypothetical protein